MPRYILVDHRTGLIWADTADLCGNFVDVPNPVEAARVVDATLRDLGSRYDLVTRLEPHETGYVVHMGDQHGQFLVPVVRDGRDPARVGEIVAKCPVAGVVRVTHA